MKESAPTDLGAPAGAPYPDAERLEERFARKIQGLLEISNMVGSVMELDAILDQIAHLSAEILELPICSVYLFGPHRENLTLRASTGLDPSAIGLYQLPIGSGLVGASVQTNMMVTVPDAQKDPRFERLGFKGEETHHAYICGPLRIQEQIIGVMSAQRYDVHAFTAEECTLFETICKQVAIVVEKSQMYYEMVEVQRLAAISISLSEVAHYIKNLLQGMKGGTYFVELGLKRGNLDMTRKGWDVLQGGNRKIASLVENMLNYSREVDLNLENHNINSIVYEILRQVDDTAVERGVALLPETQRDLPNVMIDYDRIHDALLNLITNAIDAIPPDRDGGLVIVRTRLSDDGRYVETTVEDNGSGMTPETQRKAFNLFFSTKGASGTGIGLAVTRKVIEKHDGRITVSSTPGQGSIFTMRLPVNR